MQLLGIDPHHRLRAARRGCENGLRKRRRGSRGGHLIGSSLRGLFRLGTFNGTSPIRGRLCRRLACTVVLAAVVALLWPAARAQAAPPVQYDVVVYGTTTSGIGAVRAITLLRRVIIPESTTVAIVSSGNYLESPLANGLMIEDMYLPEYYANGLWREWRRTFGQTGRLKVTSADAAYWLRWRLNKPGVTYYAASLGAVDASTKSLTLQVQGGEEVTIAGKVVIDASPTLDLARAFGCEYRIGKDETVYGPDLAPIAPTAANGFITAPQAMAGLPTFRIVGSVPTMWSTTTGRLPNGLCEFNEAISDYRVAQDVFDWVFHPELRTQIRDRVRDWSISKLYPGMTLVYSYPWPYFRGEVTIANGLVRFTGAQVGRRVAEPVARSCYSRYDRHDLGGNVSSGTAVVWAPWRAMMPAEFDWLLVTDGACVDYAAYNSSFRMEPMRMDYGGAAGTTAALALARGISPQAVRYEDLRAILVGRLGYRF